MLSRILLTIKRQALDTKRLPKEACLKLLGSFISLLSLTEVISSAKVLFERVEKKRGIRINSLFTMDSVLKN